VVGTATAGVYVLKALMESRGDWARFWMGARAPAAAFSKKEE
jgi:hypothetical protein